MAESPKRGGALPPKPSGTIKEPSERRASAAEHRLPDDFTLTEDDRQYAIDKGVNPNDVFEDFRLYWQNATGKNAKKKNWHLAWKFWVRSEIKMYPNKYKNRDSAISPPPGSPFSYVEM